MPLTYSWPGTIADGTIDPDSPIDTALMTAIRNSLTHNYEWIGKDYTPAINHNHDGANSAPLGNGSVTEALLASSAVSQGKLKTTLNNLSAGAPASGPSLLSGGRYCFLTTVSLNTGSGGDTAEVIDGFAHIDTTGPILGVQSVTVGTSARGTEVAAITYQTQGNDGGVFRTQYISASPPYDPFGLGDHLLFTYALIDKTTGVPKVVWTAEDPPWANNGPTAVNPLDRARQLSKAPDPFAMPAPTQADFDAYWAELRMLYDAFRGGKFDLSLLPPLSQAEKNADMDLIPHPLPHDPTKYQIVLLSGDIVENLWMREMYAGDDVGSILLRNYLIIDNTPIPGATKYPRDCLLARARFKLTG